MRWVRRRHLPTEEIGQHWIHQVRAFLEPQLREKAFCKVEVSPLSESAYNSLGYCTSYLISSAELDVNVQLLLG